MRIPTLLVVLPFSLALLAGSCSPRPSGARVSFHSLVERLADRNGLARLDEPETILAASHDPKGGNEDYNQPVREDPKGWWVLADLKGPGYVSRFWFTTSDPAHRIRLYFDNERTPRIDTTVRNFCGGLDPFLPPLAAYENLCYYNYVPLPYAKRLVIMVGAGGTEAGGWPRVFHQINYTTLPAGTSIETLPKEFGPEDRQALQAAAETWNQTGVGDALPDSPGAEPPPPALELDLPAGTAAAIPALEGPALIREIRVTPRAGVPGETLDWNRFLRDVVIRLRWDRTNVWSVQAPIGDFFGSVWQRVPYQSLYFGAQGDTLICRFPMPFAQAAELQLENQGAAPVAVAVQIDREPIDWDGRYGYFHAAWRRSSPEDVGRPHVMLETEGRGRYAGSLLSVTTLDKTFWILEGDETMWRDGQAEPFWQGTGLEDYFNGGWYYQNVLTRALHGLPFKTFFRTVQYRLHRPDPVMFQKAFRMTFERGPDQASRGWLESVAYYYLDRPRSAPATLLDPERRQPPQDQFAQATVMQELLNHERFGDYAGARGFIDRFLRQYPDFPFAEMLRLRQAAYTERIDGIHVAQPLYEQILAASTNAEVRQQAADLLWFHESPTHALLGVYCNTDMNLYLDGYPMVVPGNPERLATFRRKLDPGRHALAFFVKDRPYPYWDQVYLRTHGGGVFTTTDWKQRYDPAGDWKQAAYDDGEWPPVGWSSIKGPPDEPYVWMEPNAHVDMQSKPASIWPTLDWPDKTKRVILRTEFDLP